MQLNTMENCSICYEENEEDDVFMACKVCRRNGICLKCERKLERCPFCRNRFRTVIPIVLPVTSNYHEVDSILDHRTLEDGEEQFLILWTMGEESWESAVTMWEDIPELCEEYLQNL